MSRYTDTLRIALLMGLALTGCDGLLEENPLSTITPANFYNDREDAVTAVNGAYQILHSSYYIGGRDYAFMIEIPTPQITAVSSDVVHIRGCLDVYICTPSNGYVTNSWRTIFEGVNRANAVIDNVPNIDGMDAGLRARVVAEAKFLRAFHYFNMVRNWGGVPLFANETKGLTELARPRAPVAEIYDFIITDLEEAKGQLPVSYPASEFGRASKGAAQALLAKVYLQRAIAPQHDPYGGDPLLWPVASEPDDLEHAVANLREVIQSGQYSLVPDYAMMWNEATEMNSEVIWALPNIMYVAQGMNVNNFLAPQGSGWGVGQWLSANGELPFWQSYPESDKRRPVTWLDEYVDTQGERRVFDPDDVTGDNYPGVGLNLRKYLIERRDVGIYSGNPRDFPILRYADVLLMLAEAINEQQGPTDEAYQMINRLRARAGVAPIAEGMGKAEFREAIYDERGWELSQEQHSWYDRQRFLDLFQADVVAHSQLADELPTYAVPRVVLTPGDLEWLMPIPQGALDRNAQLSQNPGY